MKYKLIIDKDAEEEIVATVHAPSLLTQQIEDLVCGFSGADCIIVLDRRVFAIDTGGKRYLLKDRLRDLEAILPTYFIRINKSTLANEHRIQRFHAAFSGGVDAFFLCGYREYVSRRCFAEIKRRYEGV